MSRKEPPSRVVLVECKPDERLIRLLGVPRSRIRHEGSKRTSSTRRSTSARRDSRICSEGFWNGSALSSIT
jgi:hypothetical protein